MMRLILGRVTRVLNRPVDFDAGPGEQADVRACCSAHHVLLQTRGCEGG